MHTNPERMAILSNYPLLFIMSAIHGHMIHLQNNTMNKLLCLSITVVCSYIIHSNQVSMSGIQERMLRQYTCHILCLSIRDIWSAFKFISYYECHSIMHAQSPLLLTIMSTIQGHMLHLHSYLPLCLPSGDICSASIATYHCVYHSMT